MRSRGRVLAAVLIAAGVAASATVAVAVLTSGGDGSGVRPRKGAPPLALDLGVRIDAEARALRGAESLYAAHRRDQAGLVFARFDSVQAQVGAAFSRWPDSALVRLERLAAQHRRSSFVQFHLGLARFWAGRDAAAVSAWRAAARAEPDTPSAIRADDLLHPNFPRGRPTFVPSFEPPVSVAGLSPSRQLAFFARSARRPDVKAKLLYGLALQRLGHPLSARRAFDAAVALEPANAEAHVAAAVVRFDKAHPSAAFARVGPLTRRFPRAQSVRFHLGLLLLWLARVQPGSVEEGKAQLRRSRALAPRSRLAREATRLLASLEIDRNR